VNDTVIDTDVRIRGPSRWYGAGLAVFKSQNGGHILTGAGLGSARQRKGENEKELQGAIHRRSISHATPVYLSPLANVYRFQ